MSTTLSPRESRGIVRSLQSPLESLRGEMDDWWSRFSGDRGLWRCRCFRPHVDLAETDKNLLLEVDLPGVQAGDISVQVNGKLVTISGERELAETEGARYYQLERPRGKFSRTITLPCEVQEQKTTARDKDGVLTITLPKCRAAQSRRIPVKV